MMEEDKMEKLKTLKDLKLCEKYCQSGKRCIPKILKKEAIKIFTHYTALALTGEKVDWRKVFWEFHNITEEDLK